MTSPKSLCVGVTTFFYQTRARNLNGKLTRLHACKYRQHGNSFPGCDLCSLGSGAVAQLLLNLQETMRARRDRQQFLQKNPHGALTPVHCRHPLRWQAGTPCLPLPIPRCDASPSLYARGLACSMIARSGVQLRWEPAPGTMAHFPPCCPRQSVAKRLHSTEPSSTPASSSPHGRWPMHIVLALQPMRSCHDTHTRKS